jgi:DNA ligase-1
MKQFAELLDRLVFTPSRNAKLRLITEYFRSQPDPDRGYALASLTGQLDLKAAKPATIRALIEERSDPVLFRWSYDYVGDLAETVALMWPERPGANRPPELSEVVERLRRADRSEVPNLVAGWLDALDATGRWAFLKLLTGGLRVGVSERLAKTALAGLSQRGEVSEIEEVWHGLEPPYDSLFAWLEGRADKPEVDPRAAFRPMMLANPLNDGELDHLDPANYLAEWKWDGIRVQATAGGERPRLFSRTGEDISHSFPELIDAMKFDAVLDGELLVARHGEIAPFNDLQQRLGRKSVTARAMSEYPAFLRVYDILFERQQDLRELPFLDRRRCLEDWYDRVKPERIDLSPLIEFRNWQELAELRDDSRARGIEGLMLKRADSTYVSGRPRGPWFKWKRDALTVDCVLMYAQRGHGKRSSFFSDYTFGCWRESVEGGEELVPVGKAYFGFTDEELRKLDKWVRANTVDRFGPVRAVSPGLVLEIAFDAVHRSNRHKSGLAMRFPRVRRIRWDKPAAEADRLPSLEGMLED